ncbi:hypothetical protein [Kitasatospora sp. HPMI-4]|uniref:hypothetical protein n=1 Tax=Kitasatospora sp. HPMI-4 TaxID=3448443 RepID=UPI003F1B9B32
MSLRGVMGDDVGVAMQREHLGGVGDRRARPAGPTLLEVLPALALTVLALALPLSGLLMLAVSLGWWTCLTSAVIAVVAGLVVLRWHRTRSNRTESEPAAPAEAASVPAAAPPMPARAPHPAGAAQIAALDDAGYRAAVARLLDRDGWQVREIPVGDDVHLVGDHRADGTRIGLRCLRGESSAGEGEDSAAPLRPIGAPPAGAPTGTLWLMVSTGSWSRATVRWAVRTNVRLVDAPLLDRWCAGEDLADLLHLRADPPATAAR